ncbi:MAG: hypothetical protein E3J78_06810, partial [Candidatus Cloacimonadota bacterium]
MSYLTVFLLLVSVSSYQSVFNNAMDTFSNQYTEKPYTVHYAEQNQLEIGGLAALHRDPRWGKDSLVIGDTPGETLFINGIYDIPMDIYIVNDGVMLLRNANLSIKGNITLANQGIFDCDSSEVHFLQDYIYHFAMFIADSSAFIMRNTTTTF